MKKKKILFHSNYSRAFTGFGKNTKNILRYLFETEKYEIVEAANGIQFSSEETKRQPWKSYGTFPPPEKVERLKAQDPNVERSLGYGAGMIDELINLEKPDIYVGTEDIWGFLGYWDKPWWDKINCMIWTTLDSLPILPEAINAAPKIRNYYVWASFAERAMKELGYDHVQTLRGSLDTNNFFKLTAQKKQELRNKFNLSDSFVIGFVFRNQLRKSVPNLLDGFNLFRQQSPQANAKLLLHTHWSEGWDIPRLLREKGIPNELVYTTYFCHACSEYEVKPFTRQHIPCKFCGTQNSQVTTNVTAGVSDKQLNEIYNLMDVYCHPFTSGGQEIPIQEAKLTELITLVTNYSCGEDSCTAKSGGVPLEWAEYREPGTQFIKASTLPESICKKISDVYFTHPDKRERIGKIARQWVIDNFSIEVIGKKLEKIFDEMPEINYSNISFEEKQANADYKIPQIEDNEEFIINIFKNILNEDIDKNHASCIEYCNQLKFGVSKEQIFNHLIEQAKQKLNKPKSIDFEELLDKDDAGKRMAVVIPQSGGDVLLVNALLSNLKELYNEYNLYVFTDPRFFDLIRDNPAVHKCVQYAPMCDDLLFLEGKGSHKGFFELAFLPHITTQKVFGYQHNGKDKLQFSLK
jgi:glycosyltransferase involved in cell wall biosynthesis